MKLILKQVVNAIVKECNVSDKEIVATVIDLVLEIRNINSLQRLHKRISNIIDLENSYLE